MQSLLWDRRVVLSVLDAIGVPTPPRLVISRDNGAKVDPEAASAFKSCTGMDMDRVLARYATNTESIHIDDHYIEVNGERLEKTFIEKPADGENHNINIYYSEKKGGGGRRLFRKVISIIIIIIIIIMKIIIIGYKIRLGTNQASLIRI